MIRINPLSFNVIDQVSAEHPSPNGRYSVWVLVIINNDYKSVDLESVDNICSEVFEKYKGYLYEESAALYEGQEMKQALLIVGKTEIRKRYKTLGNNIKKLSSKIFIDTHKIEIGKSTIPFERINIDDKEVIISSSAEAEYSGRDINLLNDPANFYQWQTEIHNIIWDNRNNRFTLPHDRHIYWIQDRKGNTGKSIFVKWLCVSHPKEIIKVSFGTPNQLRSSLISAGTRRCYFIDIPRTTTVEDKLDNLLSIIEDVKIGFVTTNFYGKYGQLLMEPPHIFIFSNDRCPKSKLSEDRWQSYSIDKNFKLVKNN